MSKRSNVSKDMQLKASHEGVRETRFPYRNQKPVTGFAADKKEQKEREKRNETKGQEKVAKFRHPLARQMIDLTYQLAP